MRYNATLEVERASWFGFFYRYRLHHINFKCSLDAEMKRLQSQGIGSKKRQAEPLSIKDEDILWERELLGDHSPQTLLNTMVFCNGLYFALRSGMEHRQLRFHSSQIQLIEHDDERPYLKYTEDVSKNRPGGIKGRNIKPKVVLHHANTDNRSVLCKTV